MLLSSEKSKSLSESPRIQSHQSDSTDGEDFMPNPTQELFRPKETAMFLGVSIATLWRMPHKDQSFPKPLKVAGMTRWRRSDLELYINQRAEAA